MILITSLGEFPFIILQSFFLSFISLLKKKKKKRNFVLQDLCCLVSVLFVTGIHFQWIENFKASSLGYVGKLTERKWNTHMESNTVRRVTLELT